jgi:hypothetical protein
MVEIRVAVADPAGAHGLLRRLAGLFDRSSVSFDGTLNEVRVRSEWESRSIVQVIATVESWLVADCIDSAKLSVGDRSYTMLGAGGPRGTERTSRVTALVPQLTALTNGKAEIPPVAKDLAG